MKQDKPAYTTTIPGTNYWIEWKSENEKYYWYEPVLCFCVDTYSHPDNSPFEDVRIIAMCHDGISAEINNIDDKDPTKPQKVFYCAGNLIDFRSDVAFGVSTWFPEELT